MDLVKIVFNFTLSILHYIYNAVNALQSTNNSIFHNIYLVRTVFHFTLKYISLIGTGFNNLSLS